MECERPDLQFVLVAARRVKELTRDGEALSRDMVVRCVNALEVSVETCCCSESCSCPRVHRVALTARSSALLA